MDDEYFRLALSFRADVYDHPDAKIALASSMRSLQKPTKKRFSRRFLDGIRTVALQSPAGLHLGTAGAYDVDLARLDRVVCRIVRGLFYHERRSRFPIDGTVRSWADDGLIDLDHQVRARLQRNVIEPTLATPPRVIGNDVLRYWLAYDEAHEYTGAWVLRFYGKVNFLAVTLPAGSVPPS